MTMLSTSFDQDADAMYIKLAEGDIARTIDLNEGTLVDLDADGNVLGVEVIHPVGGWPVEELIERFSLNEMTARTVRLCAKSAQSVRSAVGRSSQTFSGSGSLSQLVSC